MLLSLLVGCQSDQSRSNNGSLPLRIGVSESSGQDPQTGISQLVDQITTENLTGLGPDGRAVPRLARSWSWERDERRLRLSLRDDVRLHDGRQFDAQLAAEALAIAISRGSNRALYPALRDVTAAIPDGRFDLLLDLSNRSALLPEDLTVVIDVPAGPYRAATDVDGMVELERFSDYYRGTPSIPRIVLRPFDTLRTTWASLLRGELDFVYDVPAEAVQFVQSDDVQVLPVRRWYQFVIAFNSSSGALRSPEVRRALNMAVDRDSLVSQILQGAGSPSSGPIWPDYWAAEATTPSYRFDPAAAGLLMDAAGFPLRTRSDGGPASRFTFTCLIPAGFSVLEQIALHVQRSLFHVGVDVQFEVLPSTEELGARMGARKFEAVLLDMISGPTPGRASIFWTSARRFQGFNLFGYENAETDRLFETLRVTRNEAAVRSSTTRLQRALLDDPPALFLAWNERARAIRREFVSDDEPGIDPVFSLWRWTRRPDTLAASAP